MSRKQKVVSSFPSLKEWHTLGGYNFNGPGTKVSDRLSLNYKDKVGTESYFLPVNKLDRVALQHDLLYYAPDNIGRIFSDKKYTDKLNSMTSRWDDLNGINIISKSFITTQASLRIYKELAKVGFIGRSVFEMIKGFLHILSVPVVPGRGSVMGDYFNPATGTASPRLKAFVRKWFEIKGTRRGNQDLFRQKIFKRIGMMLFSIVLSVGARNIENLKEFRPAIDTINNIWNTFKHTKRWLSLKSINDNVLKMYDNYLDVIGSYDTNGDFVI